MTRAGLAVALALVTTAAAGDEGAGAGAQLCPLPTPVPAAPEAQPGVPPDHIELSADRGKLEEDGPSTFYGDVRIVRGSRALRADRVLYDDAEGGVVHFSGEARYWDESLFWEGDNGQVAFERRFGRLAEGRYQLRRQRGRGWADVIVQDNEKDLTRLNGVSYTTCAGEVPAWRFVAASIKLDHDRNWGRAKHLRLHVKDVPVLYLPLLTFPLTNERKSGFLPPTVGNNADSGLDVRIPYYWNIHPAYDMTVTPRVLGDRGLLLGGEFRYLLEDGRGQIGGEILPSDSRFDDRTRSIVQFTHHQWFHGRRGNVQVDFNQVSDEEYFEDFGNSLSVTSTRFLDRRAELRYRSRNWQLFGRVQDFQTVDRSLIGRGPYARLPQLRLRSRFRARNFRPNLAFNGESVYFDRPDDTTGYRLDLRPALRLPMLRRGWSVQPEIELRHTQYLLEDAPTDEDNPSRTVPVATLDARLFLERELELGGIGLLQSLEPRAFYVYIPEVEQDDIPRFDTGRFDFTFRQLFRPDRFSGRDRVGDTNQLTLAMTTRIIETETGFERLRAGLGQIFFFKDRELQLDGQPRTTDFSEFIGELSVNLTRALQVSGTLQWDPEASRTEKGALSLRYRPGNGTIVNLDYRLRRSTQLARQATDVEQTDVSFNWPVTRHWSAFGRWNYSLVQGDTLEVVGGVQYNSCCWGVRAAARRFLSTATGAFDTGIFLQIELKGLAGFGRETTSFLKKNIPGYEQDF